MIKSINNFIVNLFVMTFLTAGCDSPSGSKTATNDRDTITIGDNGGNAQTSGPTDLMLTSMMNAEFQKAISEPIKSLSDILAENGQNIETKIQNIFLYILT